MDISSTVAEAINTQIGDELFSSHSYLSMAAFFESESYDGFAHWMRLQAQEELEHAMRLFDYVNRRGGRVVLGILIYALYSNILVLWRSWVADGVLPAWLGLWWAHLLVLLIGLVWLQRQGRMPRSR